MIRGTSTTRLISTLAVTISLVLGGCSGPNAPVESTESTGAVGLSLDVGGGVVINSETYVITGPSGFSKTGTIDLSAATALSATIGGIPAGSGYTLTLSGSAADGTTNCTGSATFNVTARATTQ